MIGLFSFIIIPYRVNWAGENMEVEWFNIMPELKEDSVSKIDAIITTIWYEWW
jgi:hypothetical protein